MEEASGPLPTKYAIENQPASAMVRACQADQVGNGSGHPVTQSFPVWPTTTVALCGEAGYRNLVKHPLKEDRRVNLRNLVPALGLVALTSAPALAADAMPAGLWVFPFAPLPPAGVP